MAQPQTFTIRAGQDLVIDGFSLGSVGLRFEGSGLSSSNLLIDQSGADTVLSFVGSNTRVRLTNFESRGLTAGDNFSQTFEFTSVVSANPTGTGLNDTISGNTRSETISGGGGNDSIAGGRGNDRIFGDAGNDTVRGDQGNDTIDGGTGIDLLLGGEGNDTLQFVADGTWPGGWAAFNAGDPGAAGSGQTYSITGMNRSLDVFDGGSGTDTLRLTGGNDAIFLDDPFSSAAQSGARIRGIERIEAGDGNDVVDLTSNRFSLGAVTVDGGAGNDVIWTSAGNDSVSGGTGSDNIWGGSGRDTLSGGDNNDTIDGGRGNDLLLGGAGDDVIRGGAGVENATINVTTAFGGGGQSSWAGVNLSAQNVAADGSLTASSASNVSFTGSGIGANGQQSSRPPASEAGYDPVRQASETVSVAFASDVSTASITLSAFVGPVSGADYNLAEQAFWRILNDGAVVATGTVTATGTGAHSFVIDPPGNLVFDTIVMWAGPYVSATGAPAQGAITNDSSDFLIRAISTTATVADEAARGGNDRIIGGGGNDNIDGGTGIDTSVYSSFISDYVFSRNASGALVVTGAGAGAVDGADTLVNVEFLEFLNGVVVPTANLGLNAAPDAQNSTATGNEDTVIAGQLAATDANGDALTYALGQGPANGTLTLNPNGSYSYTPNANFNGTDTFTYSVSDGRGGTDTATVTLDVASVNDGPTTSGGAATGAEDGTVTGTLTGADVDGGTLSFALAPSGAPANGSVTINPNGTYSYTPAANFNGTDSFTYAVSDGQGGTTLGTISVTVSPTNDAPTTSGATVAGQEDGSIAGQVTGADVDGNPLTFALGQGPANGAVTMNPNGTFNYVPAANFNGTDTFTYSVSDGQGGTTTGTVSVNVAAVNDAPTTAGGAAEGAEDGTITGTLTGADVDGDTLTFALAPSGAPANGSVTINPNGTYSYTPAANFVGTDSFTYAIADGNGGVTLGTISVTTTSVNDTPTTSGATVAGQEDGSITGQVTGADVDGNPLTFALGQGPANGAVTMNPNGTFNYVPAANFNGTDTFTYSVSDGQGGTTTGTVSVNVAAVNDGPTSAGGTSAGNEDTAITGTLTASDVDGDAMTFALAAEGGPSNGTVTVNPDGSYSYTPNADYAGSDSFSYTVTDANGATTTATMSVDVAPVADTPNVDIGFGSPTVNAGTSSVTMTDHSSQAGYNNSYGYYTLNDAGEPVSGQIVWADVKDHLGQSVTVPGLDAARTGFFIIPNGDNSNPGRIQDGESVSFVKGSDGKWIAVDAQGNAFAGSGGANAIFDVPALNVGGRAMVVDNGTQGNQNWEDIAVGGDRDFNDVNTSAIWASDNNGTSAYPLNVSASPSDRDGSESLTGVTLTGLPAGSVLKDPSGAIVTPNADGSFSLTPAQLGSLTLITPPGFTGALNVTATATAQDGATFASGSDSASTQVGTGNLGPVTSGGIVSGNEDTATTGQLQAQDPNGDPLTFSIAQNGGPAHGTVTINPNGSYTYTPAANYNGADSFTYTVSDGNGGTATGTIVVNVASVNDAPTTAGGTASGNEDTVVTGALSAADIDGGTLSFALAPSGAPANGSVTINPNGTYSYTPAANFNGTDSFTYRVSDGQGGTVTGTVSIVVSPTNDAPVTSGATVAGQEDGSIAGQVTGTDVDGNALSFALGQGPANGSVTMNPDGTFNYVPVANFNGTDTFTYSVSDGQGGTTTGIVSVNVAAVNDAPTTSGGTASGNEDTTITGQLTGADIDGDTLSYALAANGGPANGTVTVNSDGSYSYVPAEGFAGADSFTYTVSDGKGGTATSTVTVDVAPVDSVLNYTVDGTWPGGWAAFNAGSPGAPGTGETISITGMGRTFGVYDGGAGSNTLVMADGNNALFLDDRYSPPTLNEPRLANIDTIELGVGNQLIDLTSHTFALGDLTIEGNTGNDTIWSSAGDDLITAGAGADRVYAGVGDDTVAGGQGSDNLHGAAGTDTAVFTGSISDYIFQQNAMGVLTVTDTRPGAPDGTDTLTSFEFLSFLDGTISSDGLGLNRPPVAPNVGAAATEDTVAQGQLVGQDADGDTLTFALAQNGAPAHGTVTVNPDGSYSYTPAANFNGTDTFSYTVSDGRGGSSTGTVTMTVASVNDAPTTAGGAAAGNEDAAIYGAVSGADIEGDDLAFALGQGPAHGTVTLNADGTYIYTPAANYFGADTFTYTVSDGNGGTATGTVSVEVAPVNDTPDATAQSVSGREDATVISGQALATDVDGDSLTYALAPGGGPTHGSLTFRPDGSFDFVPAANFNGSDSFAYTASDGQGGTTTATMTIYVAPANDVPTAPGQTVLSGSEDTLLTGTLPAADIDGDTLTFAFADTGLGNVGMVTVNPDGTFEARFPHDYSGPFVFDYTATDPTGASVVSRIFVNVAPMNDAPWVQNASTQVNEDYGRAGFLSFGDVDLHDGVTLSLAPGGAPANGIATVAPSGHYTYTPNPNFNGTDSFQFAATDSSGATTIGTVTVTVTSLNDAPVIVSSSATGNEDTAISGQLSATDVDGDAITYYLPFGADPTNGQLSFNPDGSFTFVPNANWNGQVQVYYHARDAQGAETGGTLVINVAAVNDGPVALTTSASGAEDTVLAGNLTASDIDGDMLTFGLAPGGAPQHGELTILPNGSYTYVPNADYNGADSFTYTVSDGNGGIATKTVAVEVAPVNDTPVAQDQSANGTEDNSISGQLAATDVDGDTLSYSIAASGQPLHGTVALNLDGSFTYVPRANYNGTDRFSYEVSDGKGGLTVATVSLNIAAVNDAPIAGTGALVTNEDTVLAGRLSAFDADGNTLTFALVGGQGPANGSLSLQANGNYVYTPAPNFNGTDSFAYTVSDGQGGTATRTVTVSVAAVNDAPTTAGSTVSGTEDSVIVGQVTAADVDGDNLSFSVPVSGRPAHGTVTMNSNGSYSYVPNADFNGTDSFTYRVSDGKGGFATGTVAVNVAAVNDAPVVASGPIPGIEDTVVSGRVSATDPEGGALTFALVSNPAHGSLTFASDGSYTYAPSANFNGVDTFVFSVSDGNGGVTTVTQSIQIAGVNDAPTTANSAATGMSEQPIIGQLVATDIDGDVPSFAIAANGGPAHGTLALQPNGSYVYTPALGFDGADSFTYTVSDGNGGFASATVSLTIVGGNDAPIAGNTSFTLAEDTPLTGNLGIVDPEGNAFSMGMAQGPTHGTVQFGPGGTFTYTPGANYNGADSFVVTLMDSLGATRNQTISLDVTPVVDVPHIAPINLSIQEDSGTIAIPLNVINPDGYGVAFGAGSWGTQWGVFTKNPEDNTLYFTPHADANGIAEFGMLYWDTIGNGAYAPVTVEIVSVDDGPRAINSLFYGSEDSTLDGRLETYDPEGGTVVDYRLAQGPAIGEVTVNPDGTFAFTAPPNWFGTQTFTYVATDSTGASSTLTATVELQNVYDALVLHSRTFTGTEDTLVFGRLEAFNPDDLIFGGAAGWSLAYADGSSDHLSGGNFISRDSEGIFTFRPDNHWFGTTSFQIYAYNAAGHVTEPVTITFEITPVNDAPIMSFPDADYGHMGVTEDTAFTGNLAVDPTNGYIGISDIESPLSALTFDLARQAEHGTVTISANGDFIYMPARNFSGWDTFAYTVTDPDGATIVVEAGRIYVSAVPETIEWQTSFAAQGNHQLFGDVANSEGPLVLAVVQENDPIHGSLTFNSDGTFVYTPMDGFSGTDSFTVTAYGEAGGVTQQIYITVDPNDAPVVQPGTTEGAATAPIQGQLAATDAEGDTLLYTLLTPPGEGNLTLNLDGSFVYEPGASVGPQTFEYQVADGYGGVTTATHTIEVYGAATHTTGDAAGNWTLSNYVNDTVHLTDLGPEGPDTIVGFQAAEDKIDVSALFGTESALPPDWAAQLTAYYDAGAGGTFIGVSAEGGGSPEWGVLLQGVNTTLDDLLNQGALQASQNNTP
jgi:large repetitive protein